MVVDRWMIPTENLTTDQYGLAETPILTLDELLGNVVQKTQDDMKSVAGIYQITVPSGTVKLDIDSVFLFSSTKSSM